MKALDQTGLRRRFVLITALTWLPLGMGMAALLLLMAARGLSLSTIGAVLILQSLTVTALELPTGGLADVIGRRGVLAVSAAVGIAAFAWTALGTTVWEFACIAVLRGIARALSSGPAEAWYVDSVHAIDSRGDIRRGLSYSQTASSVGLGVGTLVGGALPLIVPLPDRGLLTALSAPMLVSAGLYAMLLLVVLFGLPEPTRGSARPKMGELFAAVPSTMLHGIRLGFRNRALTRLLMTFAIGGVALTSVELLTPGRIDELTGDPNTAATVYGVITAIGFAASGLGSALSTVVTRRLGGRPRSAAVLGVLVGALGLVTLFGTGGLTGMSGLVATGTGYGVMFMGMGLAGPLNSELIHHQVTSSERATVVSIQSLMMQGGGAGGAVLLPWVVSVWSVPGAWLVAGLLLAVSTVLYRRAKKPPVARAPELVEAAA